MPVSYSYGLAPGTSLPDWYAINGIDLAPIASAKDLPQEPKRDIGGVEDASDGSKVVTRIARKLDLTFTSIPLLSADAVAFEGLICGLGEHWSFDTSLYGSKGLGPSGTIDAIQTAGTPKFGAGVLRLSATTGTITFAGAAQGPGGTFRKYTVMVWRRESGVWHHYIVTSSGHKWLDGVRADGTSTTWLVVTAVGDVTIVNTAGATQDYDDLVVLPYEIVDYWGEIFGVATSAFSNLPDLNASGLLVTEATTRIVTGNCTSMTVMMARPSGYSLQRDMKRLSVEIFQV